MDVAFYINRTENALVPFGHCIFSFLLQIRFLCINGTFFAVRIWFPESTRMLFFWRMYFLSYLAFFFVLLLVFIVLHTLVLGITEKTTPSADEADIRLNLSSIWVKISLIAN